MLPGEALATGVPAAPAVRGDLISLGLLLAMAFCVSGAINDVGWAEGTEYLVFQSLLAVLLAFVLARSRMRPVWAASVGVLAMLAVVLVTVGGLWPPLAYVREDVAGLGFWWSELLRGGLEAAGWPFPEAGGYVSRQVTAIVWRTWVWGWRVYLGAANSDRQVWLLVISTVLSLTTFTAAWQVFRHWRVSLALLLLGAALGANSFMAGQGPTWALAFIGFGLILLARGNALGLERRWVARGTDYSDELLPYATVIGLGLAAMAIILSPLLPVLTSRSTYETFWRLFREPWSRVEETTGKWFQGLDSPQRRGLIGSGEGGPIDPSAEHRVGAGAPLGNRVVLRVRIGDPAPEPWAGGIGRLNEDVLPQRHWRAATFDTYTGSGWVNGARDVDEVPPDGALAVDHPETRREFAQQVDRRADTLVVYAVGQPWRVDQGLTVTYREGGDVVSLAGRQDEYTVVSLVPDVSVSGLEEAGEDYPAEIAERYLSLGGLPERVRRTALDVAAAAETPYAKARAVEEYLRRFEYDLAVPAAPDGRDVVDYFLFDLQRGFCDHFSTAMAVMLRVNCVPARVAVGYARGTYDDREGRWVVTEADSHAWVEVYFPGYGWVEFEPTAARAIIVYPEVASPDTGGQLFFELEEQPGVQVNPGSLLLAAVVALLLLALPFVLLRQFSLSRASPEVQVEAIYRRLRRALAGAGLDAGTHVTPDEYLLLYGESLRRYRFLEKALRQATALYRETIFSPHAPEKSRIRDASALWQQSLREWALLWLRGRWAKIRDGWTGNE